MIDESEKSAFETLGLSTAVLAISTDENAVFATRENFDLARLIAFLRVSSAAKR